jgi:predicted regulator of Ras-like GTPase activity (Roadblock/LC7/MglB family)
VSESFAARDLGWLVGAFADETPGVRDALVLSSDGLTVASSSGLESGLADTLAAVASGLVGLANGAATPFRAGRVAQIVVELEHAFVFVTGISDGSALAVVAEPDCDLGLIAYEMAVLVDRAGTVLTPALRNGDPAGHGR